LRGSSRRQVEGKYVGKAIKNNIQKKTGGDVVIRGLPALQGSHLQSPPRAGWDAAEGRLEINGTGGKEGKRG